MNPWCLGVLQLQLGLRQPLLHALLLLRATAPQPLLQHRLAGRRHKDIPRVHAALLDLLNALHLDVQHHDAVLGSLVRDRLPARAVAVAAERRVLDEAVGGDELCELVVRHEVVVHAVGLAVARRAGRVRDGEGEGSWVALAEEVEERAFADAAGARDYEGSAVGGEGGRGGGGRSHGCEKAEEVRGGFWAEEVGCADNGG